MDDSRRAGHTGSEDYVPSAHTGTRFLDKNRYKKGTTHTLSHRLKSLFILPQLSFSVLSLDADIFELFFFG